MGATMYVDTEEGAEVVAMIGRACAILLDDFGWTPEQLRLEVTGELEELIIAHPR